jgi:DNA-binding NarL/FixJ family response regulator
MLPASNISPAERPSLLIADDDPVVRSTLSMALEPRFDIIAVAGDGEDAVAKAADRTPDAALLDVDMPRGGGIRAVRGIAAASPNTALVILSGDEAEEVVLELLQAGAVAYCRKGQNPHHLADTIDRSIRAHRALSSSPAA